MVFYGLVFLFCPRCSRLRWLFLAPHVGDAIAKYTPLDDVMQEKIIEAFLPDMSAESLADKDLSGTPLSNIPVEDIPKMTDLEWERLGITTGDIMKIFGDIPKDQQIKDIEDSTMPEFLKEMLLENNNTAIYEVLGWNHFRSILLPISHGCFSM